MKLRVICVLLLWWSAGPLAEPATPLQPQHPPQAAIASAHPLATAAGFEILQAGGNAFDAAVAVTAALAVVEPYSSGLGGGGFWLLHRASDSRQWMLDGRERAPLASRVDMYLDDRGEPTRASLEGPLSAAIPGTPAALVQLALDYGRLPLGRSLAPAIRLAREGFAVTPPDRRMAEARLPLLRLYPSTAEILLAAGAVPEEGHLVVQKDLAKTLERLAQEGTAGFYAGRTADLLVASVRAAGGIWTHEDLIGYRVVEREPIVAEVAGARLVSAAPPSSGGIALATMLGVLNGFDLAAADSATRVHLIVEAMRRAYRDRAEHLGDPDHWPVPVAELLDPAHLAALRADIDPRAATPSASLPQISAASAGGAGADTTHFSILDTEGNRVAATLSINYPFGSGFVVPGTGVLLNDEMDDFSARPGAPNAYGLVGAEANAIAPGKRPLSSMSPTFIETADRLAILGTPGGSRIISMVLLAGLEFLEGGTAASMVSLPRFHHQYLPDVITYEPGVFDAPTIQALSALGHDLAPVQGFGEGAPAVYGNMQVVVWDRPANRVEAASDPRGEGAAEAR